VIEQAVAGLPTLMCERIVPPIANHVPHLILSWDERRVKIGREQLTKELAAGDPPILIGRVHGTGDKGVLISVFVLQGEEVRIVADRLRAIFEKVSV
jgi:L-seryl-tRNA(Ser) seleniumtransferase